MRVLVSCSSDKKRWKGCCLFPSISKPRFAKPMSCNLAFLHDNDETHENGKDNSDLHNKGIDGWSSDDHRNHGNDENLGNLGCKPKFPQNLCLWGGAKGAAKASCGETVVQKGVFGESVSTLPP